MKNEYLLDLKLHKKVPKKTGAYVWTQIKKCPKSGDIYQDFCMDYGCESMDSAICKHPDGEIINEGCKKSSSCQSPSSKLNLQEEIK